MIAGELKILIVVLSSRGENYNYSEKVVVLGPKLNALSYMSAGATFCHFVV